jgi:type IV pilus assembly protein PilA
MLMPRHRLSKREAGTILIEFMTVVALVGILAQVALPNFITYRNNSRVAAGVGTGEDIRTALAAFAAHSTDKLFPATGSITSYSDLSGIVNRHGGALKATAAAMGIALISYSAIDGNEDGMPNTYALMLSITGVPSTFQGNFIRVTPEGITRCPDPAGAC